MTHGCAAGLHQQVFDEVLLKRVWRDRRTNFSTRRLGMTGSDLVALSNYFYPQQWTELRTPSLSARARVLVLTNAGVRLRQLGRLVDARDSFGAVVREIDPQAAQAEELEDASYATAAYCELLVIAGKLTGGADESEGALFNGQRAVEFSDQGDDAYFSMHARISLAEVYFMLNDLEQARRAVRAGHGHRPGTPSTAPVPVLTGHVPLRVLPHRDRPRRDDPHRRVSGSVLGEERRRLLAPFRSDPPDHSGRGVTVR